MNVLVVYASRHGATRGIAERIAQTLRGSELVVTLLPVEDVREPGHYDAFVVGSAAYMYRWLGEATSFVKHNRALLASRPLWLFSSGPLGTETVDEQGRDVLEAMAPKEFAELRGALHPRGERVFFGAWDPSQPPIGLAERFTRLMPAARDALPAGDFRDWPEIEAWAASIADELTRVPAGAR
jgi:menaquinone-dependent protoporphyrinogen oxidase